MKALDRPKEPNEAEAEDEGDESPDEDFREEAELENDAADESDGEGAGGAGRGEEEELDEGEAADLKRDLGEDLRAGKRRKRGEGVGDDDESQQGNEGDSKRGKPSQESEEAWKSIKEAAADADKAAATSTDQEEMVKVIKTYKFAGDEVREEKLLPASHPDAVAFLKKQAEGAGQPASGPAPATAASSRPAVARGGGGGGPPGPRRRKGGGLAAMSAAASARPTKINTLEKSKMDWDRFKSTADAAAADAAAAADDGLTERERDEMESQTKGGSSGLGSMKGYMERQGFLDRVEERLQNKDR